MLRDKNLRLGQLQCTIYDFEKYDDVLPPHVHDESTAHITICCKGSVEVKTVEWTKTLEAGNIVEFFAGQHHSIHALEPNSRIINIPKQYTP